MQMILEFQMWWALPTPDGFKSHVNVTEGLKKYTEDRIRVGNEESGTSDFNQDDDKFHAKQYRYQTRQLLELERWKVYGQINQ